jgi:ferredoxin
MKRTLVLSITVFVLITGFTQASTIAEIAAYPEGSLVATDAAVILSTTDLVADSGFKSFQIRDLTRAMTIYGTNAEIDTALTDFGVGGIISISAQSARIDGALVLVTTVGGFGCLGYGDCTRACKFDALHVIDGLSTVNYTKCTGCAACSRACPRNLITMVPFAHDPMVTVACSSKENGKNTRTFCKVGCIGCGICAKQTDVFKVTDNLSKINYEKFAPSEAVNTAMTKCPTKVIVHRGKNAKADMNPKEDQPTTAAAS